MYWILSWITAFLWGRGFCNSMKLWAMPGRATQHRQIIVKNSDKMWSTGGGNGKPLQYSCCENPMNSMKRQKGVTLEDEPARSKSVQYATGEKWWAITNSFRKNEVSGPKWKWCAVVDVSGSESKVWYCKEKCRMETWNARSWMKVNWICSNRRWQVWTSIS